MGPETQVFCLSRFFSLFMFPMSVTQELHSCLFVSPSLLLHCKTARNTILVAIVNLQNGPEAQSEVERRRPRFKNLAPVRTSYAFKSFRNSLLCWGFFPDMTHWLVTIWGKYKNGKSNSYNDIKSIVGE